VHDSPGELGMAYFLLILSDTFLITSMQIPNMSGMQYQFMFMLSISQAPLLIRIPYPASFSYQYNLVRVFRIDRLASHLLEHAACAVGDLLVLIAAESVAGFLLDEIETCKRGLVTCELIE
jgi:hypothetical protein